MLVSDIKYNAERYFLAKLSFGRLKTFY